MFVMSGRGAAVRMSVLAGAAALALAGLSGGAQAFPRAAAPAAAGPEAVQFYDDGYAPPMHRRGRHHHAYDRYGENAHPYHPGHAGLYDCGPGGRNTRLSKRACGGNNRFAHLNRHGYYD